jgi:ribulose-phosphate 3-epimerase
VPQVISPSVLNADLAALADEVRRVEHAADWIHLDVMDNHFVPNLTFGLPVVAGVIRATTIPADCHLMIDEPDRWAPGYAEAGAYSVTFHHEAARDPRALAGVLRGLGSRAGVALKPATGALAVEGLLDAVDMVLVMTVEPGFGGQSFMADMLPKVREIRAMVAGTGVDVRIQVDGGVDERTIEACARAGADTFVAGSAVYRSADPADMVRTLREIAESVVAD